MEDRLYYRNGARVTRGEYVVHGEDEGFLRGLSAFETMRAFQGAIFRAEAHTERLIASAHALEITVPSAQELNHELNAAVSGYRGEARVQITLTVGGSRLLSVVPMDPASPGKALRVVTLPWEPPGWLSGRVKHCSRAAAQVAQKRSGADEIFWVGSDGCLTEGARSNIFGVVDKEIVTPPDDGRILCGVTRAALIEAAKSKGFPIEERLLPEDTPFTELYASSTLRDLAPVIEMNGRTMPGRGPLGTALSVAFRELVEKECGA